MKSRLAHTRAAVRCTQWFFYRELLSQPYLSASRRFSTSSNHQSSDLQESHKVLQSHRTLPRNLSDTKSTPSNIYDSLRKWEADNPNLVSPLLDMQLTARTKGALTNSLLMSDDSDSFATPQDDITTLSEYITGDRESLVDFGNERTFLRCGDLVELRTPNGSRVELAIFIRQLQTQAQFYTMSGKWLHQASRHVLFSRPDFVKIEEVEPLLQFLPDQDIPEAMQDRLQSFELALPRDVGSSLVLKMLDFWRNSEIAYRGLSSKFDNAHELVASPEEMRYLSLYDIAVELVPEARRRDEKFPSAVLYAVHRSVMQDDLGFRAQLVGNFRSWGKFEVSSLADVKIALEVSNSVRKYQERCVENSSVKSGNSSSNARSVLRFVEKVTKIIERSRSVRKFTPHGMLGPAQTNDETSEIGVVQTEAQFDLSDISFLRFMECWSALRTFNEASTLNATGSAILRATGMYKGQELDRTTGWTFLQEIGVIPPWSNRAAFNLRLPHALGTKVPHELSGSCEDTVAAIRKDWGQLPVFCIDDVGAKEIDDGVSLEKTDKPDEYWIHVHTADPASLMQPKSPLAEYAQHMASNIYFPDHVTAMIANHSIVDRTSLARDRPCLTFSAKMNHTGSLLDYQVTAGRIHNVKYITPRTLSEIVGLSQTDDITQFCVGRRSNDQTPGRSMMNSAELSEEDRETLCTMAKLCNAHKVYTSLRGAIHTNYTNTGIKVDIDSKMALGRTRGTSYLFYNDPAINFQSVIAPLESEEPVLNPVAQMMQMAGNVAARWCHDRGIPNVNRVSQYRSDGADPFEFFSKNILPLHKSGGSVPADVIHKYLSLVSPVLPSSTPGPHLSIGMDMYCKATSPLRRYADLVTHWQIEAALLEEARTGESLVGNTRYGFLPFNKKDIDDINSSLDSRERAIKASQRVAERLWTIQALIRSWKFQESELPRTFKFIARVVDRYGVKGDIPYLSYMSADFEYPEWLLAEQVEPGNVFEVEIEDLNAYTGKCTMKAVRLIT